jgi:hypothetical protein
MEITLEQAISRIAEELCRRELKYRAASLADCGDAPAPEDWFTFDVIAGDMGEMILQSYLGKLHEFETRLQAMEYLIERKGMQPLLAFAAIDQQYNYDESEDYNGPLRAGPKDEDFPDPIKVSVADLNMVYDTWKEMLSIDESGNVWVDGEPTYDKNGNHL